MTVEYLQKEWGDGCWKLKIFWRMEEGGGETKTKIKNV